MKSLVIIPARGGSKGIPHKNIKILGGKPLICHTIDHIRGLVEDKYICVSSDDNEIIKVVEEYGLNVPFKRPENLATDTIGTYEVLLHALKFYENRNEQFDNVILLQCTSPFCRKQDIKNALDLYDGNLDMVVSVVESTSNPYYNIFEEDKNGYLVISKGDGNLKRRQEAPKTWEYNGAIYIINPESLKKKPLTQFNKIKKYEMDKIHSIDLDDPLDWKLAELMIKEELVKL